MKKLHTLLIAGVSAGVISAAVLAAPGPGPGGPHGQHNFMMFFDSNSDNVVTLDELNAASNARFEKMDVNGDGVVTLEEFTTYVGERRNEHRQYRFDSVDTNNDAQISMDEYIAHKQQRATQRFHEMDADNDGAVSADEFTTHKRGHHGAKHGRHSRHHGKPGHYGGRGFFSKLDKNGDGKITLEESVTAWTEWFNRIDADNDQVVTADEVQQFRKNMRGNW